MRLPQARLERHRGVRDQPRLMADLLRRRHPRAGRGVCRGGLRGGHQLHRHRQRLRARGGRDAARRGARRSRALLLRARHEGLLPDVRHRPGPLRGADPQADRRLAGAPQTDYVDLYQCHRFDSETPLEETMQALTEVVRAGKARHIGFSEWPVGEDRELAARCRTSSAGSPASRSTRCWCALPRRSVIPLCEREGISQIVWSPLAQGVLAGRYRPGEAAAAGLPRRERDDGRVHRAADDRAACSKRSSGCAPSPRRPG